ncbi:TetR/AcrR family transcriptional regulator [Tengunoibacter tsumagoiensis]|uniref:TetR family transcriptional regulator n=1 Tax=Tengunoibacter tsumagoiensis TaxID=2014871 RepID=A0A402A9Y8_9CHLR|nr:TetR/AcrR family transcriptional regulator [Tengunoibacter tsumagoiensis]GCE15908.1 TetR family transcriptional regulator [Tengunoibacter tsumagoiensis]
MARGEKRERLIKAAQQQMYEQGVAQTTLANVAKASDVPLGNVYYYFRTKDALIDAVLDSRLDEIRSALARFEQSSSEPLTRLKLLAGSGRAFQNQLARFGCPYASLCQELEKQSDLTSDRSGDLFRLYLDWAEQQFRLLGKGDASADLALDLLSGMQGAYLLTHSLHTPEFLERKILRLEAWLEDLA